MGERYLERIVASGIKIGTIQTLKALGLLPEQGMDKVLSC